MEDKIEVLKMLLEGTEDRVLALTGSLALYIQGIDVDVKDIDILTTKEGVMKYYDKFREYSTIQTDLELDHVELVISGIEIDIIGDVQFHINKGNYLDMSILEEKIKIIEFKGLKIPVFELEEEFKVYQRLGREDKVKLIEEFLKND